MVQRLLCQAARVGVRTRLILLDRGFYSVAVVRYLQAARYPFVMPVVCHGLSPKRAGGPTGSYVFRTWKKSGWSTYSLADAKKRTATVSICVKCRNYRGQWKRHGRQALIYAYWGYRPPSPHSVFQTYRLRFGSRRAIVRCTRVGSDDHPPAGRAAALRGDRAGAAEPVGLVALYGPGDAARGGRVILLERLHRETLLLWLLHVVEAALGVTDKTYTERDVEYELTL